MLAILLAVLPRGNASVDCSVQQCHYVRAGAMGDGSSWENASASFAARGVVNFLADGEYSALSISIAVDGVKPFIIKKATFSDHGTNVGWSTSYGDGKATFSSVTISTSYVTIDGSVGGGHGSWVSGHGIEVYRVPSATCTGNQPLLTLTGDITDVSVSHVLMRASNNNYPIRGIEATRATGRNLKFSYNAMHTLFTQAIYFKDWRDVVFEHSYIADVRSTGAGDAYCEHMHGEGVATVGINENITFRYNLWDKVQGTAVFAGINSGTSNNWKIYGNIFSRSATTIYYYNNAGTGGSNAQTMNGLEFYNNLVVGIPGYSQGGLVIPGSNNVTYNNIWYNNIANSFQISGTHNYNLFVNNRRVSDCPGTPCPKDAEAAGTEANGQTMTSSPFINADIDPVLADYRLSIATAGGLSLPSPFNSDLNGFLRGADGVWDRGPFEFGGSAPTPQPLKPPSRPGYVN